jgi:hypothetical protein
MDKKRLKTYRDKLVTERDALLGVVGRNDYGREADTGPRGRPTRHPIRTLKITFQSIYERPDYSDANQRGPRSHGERNTARVSTAVRKFSKATMRCHGRDTALPART